MIESGLTHRLAEILAHLEWVVTVSFFPLAVILIAQICFVQSGGKTPSDEMELDETDLPDV